MDEHSLDRGGRHIYCWLAVSRSAAMPLSPTPAMWPRVPAWVVGKLVHAALAAWRFPDGDGAFERWAEAYGRNYGLTDAHQLADAVNQSRTLLLRFQDHPLHAEMAGAARRLHEVPYSLVTTAGGGAGRDQHRIESGIIDALYLRDGGWTIVEFKTDHGADRAALERLLAEVDYLAQAGRYATAVEQLLGNRPAAVLCLLDHAGGVRLHHWTRAQTPNEVTDRADPKEQPC